MLNDMGNTGYTTFTAALQAASLAAPMLLCGIYAFIVCLLACTDCLGFLRIVGCKTGHSCNHASQCGQTASGWNMHMQRKIHLAGGCCTSVGVAQMMQSHACQICHHTVLQLL